MMSLTRHGWREMLIGTVVLAVLALVLGWAWWPAALATVPVLIWLLAFFRDPERPVPVEQHVLVSPADGMVSDIVELDHDERLGGPAVRIGIFLSVFNVHINRAPCDGKILSVTYRKGRFINALNHARASEENESNTVVLGDPQTGRPTVVVRQIVGLIARTIVFPHREGDLLRRGQRIGMIKFGSRTEIYIPRWMKPEVKVKVGEAVRGASDVIAVVGEGIHTSKPVPGEELEPLVGRRTPS